MFLVNLRGHIRDAFVNHVERFGPVAMMVVFGPTARRLAVGIEDGCEFELYVGEMEAIDGVDDARGCGVTKVSSHAHDSLGAGRGAGNLGLAVLVECCPFRMLAIDRGGGSYCGERNPQAQPHAPDRKSTR